MYGKFKLPLGYSQDMECRVLELPFEQKRISMFILLPDDPINGLNRLEANMTSENIKSLFSTLKVNWMAPLSTAKFRCLNFGAHFPDVKYTRKNPDY